MARLAAVRPVTAGNPNRPLSLAMPSSPAGREETRQCLIPRYMADTHLVMAPEAVGALICPSSTSKLQSLSTRERDMHSGIFLCLLPPMLRLHLALSFSNTCVFAYLPVLSLTLPLFPTPSSFTRVELVALAA